MLVDRIGAGSGCGNGDGGLSVWARCGEEPQKRRRGSGSNDFAGVRGSIRSRENPSAGPPPRRLCSAPSSEREAQAMGGLGVSKRGGLDPPPVVGPPDPGQLPPSREPPPREQIAPLQRSWGQSDDHGRGLDRMVFLAPLDEVAPDGEDRHPLDRPLPPLAERDGLPPVIGPAVAEKEIGQIDREEWILSGPRSCGEGPMVEDPGRPLPAAEPPDRSPVGRVFIALQAEPGRDLGIGRLAPRSTKAAVFAARKPAGGHVQEFENGILDRLGIGPAQAVFQKGSFLPLPGRHPSLSPQGTVGEVVEEPALAPGGQVEMEGEELGELEGLEAVDGDRFADVEVAVADRLLVEEEGLASGAG